MTYSLLIPMHLLKACLVNNMKIVIATHNKHKLKEFNRILLPLQIEAISENELPNPLPEVEETGTTLKENARLKAESACQATGMPAVADDTGLCIDALNGEPGVYSARYAPDELKTKVILEKMNGVPFEKRTARFICSICCVFPNGDVITVEGSCEGKISMEERGETGFGYDPVFECPDGQTFAEMKPEEKDAYSHRGKALLLFKEKLETYQREKCL